MDTDKMSEGPFNQDENDPNKLYRRAILRAIAFIGLPLIIISGMKCAQTSCYYRQPTQKPAQVTDSKEQQFTNYVIGSSLEKILK